MKNGMLPHAVNRLLRESGGACAPLAPRVLALIPAFFTFLSTLLGFLRLVFQVRSNPCLLVSVQCVPDSQPFLIDFPALSLPLIPLFVCSLECVFRRQGVALEKLHARFAHGLQAFLTIFTQVFRGLTCFVHQFDLVSVQPHACDEVPADNTIPRDDETGAIEVPFMVHAFPGMMETMRFMLSVVMMESVTTIVRMSAVRGARVRSECSTRSRQRSTQKGQLDTLCRIDFFHHSSLCCAVRLGDCIVHALGFRPCFGFYADLFR